MPAVSWASSPAVRKSMLGNRSRDTMPELQLRRELHRRGLRYRVNARPLVGVNRTADVVFRKAKIAVFLHGCFWHGCPDHFQVPRTNASYWEAKIANNSARDDKTRIQLSTSGWLVVIVWEHEDPVAAAELIAASVKLRTTSSI